MAKHQEGKEYLQPEQSYIDRYDLTTINRCLDSIRMFQEVYKKSKEAKELKGIPDKEKWRNVSLMLNHHLFFVKASSHKEKERTIQEWIQKDTEMQDKYDNTPVPSYYCPDCNIKMESFFKTLDHTTDDNKPLRMLFFLKCPNCNKREGIYDDGKIRESKPYLCPECGKEAEYTIEKEGKVKKWVTKCNSCGYRKEEEHDHEKWEKEWEEEKRKDKELLEKYRNEFCLSDKEGKEYVETLEAMEVAVVVKEEEMQKHDTQMYADSLKLKKTTIPDLEILLKKAVEKARYAKLEFEKPEIGQFVNTSFSVQDTDSTRTDRKSSQELEEIIKETLKDTNWRLMDRISYRLGYLQGRLKGYEQEEDMVKLVTKTQKPPKPQEKVDPEQYAKYSHHNIVQLARMMGKHDAIRNIRKRRLEKEPEGFFLEPSEGPYQCAICRRYKPGNGIWWTLDEVYCDDCRRNAEAGVIPKNLKHEYDDEGQWISEWQIKDRHGVHPATKGKYLREGFLKARHLKDSDGTIYCTIFLVRENKEFLKKHPKIEKPEPTITKKTTGDSTSKS